MELINIGLFKKSNKNKTRGTPKDYAGLWLQPGALDAFIPGYTALTDNDVIRRCVHKVADMVSSMTIMLMENSEAGDIRVKNELARIIDIYPNKYMTRKNFIYKIVSDMMLYGNAVALPDYNGTLLDNITPLNAAKLKIDNIDLREGYYIERDGIRFDPDEVLHFVLIPDDGKPFRGSGYKKQIINSVNTLLQANMTKTGFLQSKWKPSIVISINSDAEELMSPEKRKKILGSYYDETERGEPWLIPAGEIDIKTIQPLTLQDLAIQDSITLDIRTIATAIGIPPFLMGIGEFSQGAYNNFVSTTVMTFAQIIQQEMTKKLIYSPDWYFKFNAKSLMQYSLAEKSAFVNNMVNGGMLTRNEGRDEFDYTPAAAEGMDSFAILENFIPVGDIDKQKKLIQDGE